MAERCTPQCTQSEVLDDVSLLRVKKEVIEAWLPHLSYVG